MNAWHDTEIENIDPLDILVLGRAVVYPLSIMCTNPIGFMRMIDQGKLDDKIIAVHADDHAFLHYENISELALHILNKLRSFF